MADIILFTPKAELDAAANLAGFTSMCRDRLTVFGAELPFDEFVWDVTDTNSRKGQGNFRERIIFSTLESANSQDPHPMDDAFRPFAQAYIRYMQGIKPVVGPGNRVASLRALEAALRERGQTTPIHVDTGTFNRAAQLLKDHFSEATVYRYGSQLEMVAKFMVSHRLTSVPFQWRNPFPRPIQGTGRVGPVFDQHRREKLPSAAALEALPKIFHLAKQPTEVLVSAVAALLCSAPDRINEVLRLEAECEVTLPRKQGQEDAYGLRWRSSKGAEPMVKWIVPSMTSIVREALARIRALTATARRIAAWYESNPNQIYLLPHLEYLRQQEHLCMAELGDVLWDGHCQRPTPWLWCKHMMVPVEKRGRRLLVRFADMERVVLGMLPLNFPVLDRDTGLKYSEALFVVQRSTFRSNHATYQPAFEPVNIQHINDRLGARSAYGQASIFSTLGFTEGDGSPIKVTSHQFRHYLNTLAQAGGMSQLDIAKWSGRKDIRQNAAYDHVSADELLLQLREAIGDEQKMLGPLAKLPKYIPIARDEFARLKIPTAHTTEIGFCVHDYTMAPCQLHRDCINCEEHVCIKGDEAKHARIRSQLAEGQQLLAKAEIAVHEGFMGSDRWLEHHQATVERLSHLCEIMENPAIPIGSVIHFSNVRSPPSIEQAYETQAILTQSHHPAHNRPSDGPSMTAIRELFDEDEN